MKLRQKQKLLLSVFLGVLVTDVVAPLLLAIALSHRA